MIMKPVTFALVFTCTYSGNVMGSASASELLSDTGLSFGIQSKDDQDYPDTALTVVRTPTRGFPAKLDDQVGPHRYKVLDNPSAPNKDVSPVQVSKAVGRRFSQAIAASRSAVPDAGVRRVFTTNPCRFSIAQARGSRAWLPAPSPFCTAGPPDQWSRHGWHSSAAHRGS